MSQNINQHMNAVDILTLAALSILWGGSFFFIEILVKHLPPFSIVAMRVGLAAIALWAIVIFMKLPLPSSKQQWGALFVVGLLNNALPFCLIV